MSEKATVFLFCVAVLVVSLRLGYCNQVYRAPSRQDDLLGSVEDVEWDVQTIAREIKTLQQDVKIVKESVIQNLPQWMTSVNSTLANFIKIFKYIQIVSHFDVVYGSQEKMYFVTKTEAPFDIMVADFFCAVFGGHLAEIKDEGEYKFIVNFLKKVGGDEFLIGGNDINEEGHWVYWHSGKPVEYWHWSNGNPDNYKGIEDCMAINLAIGGFNDVDCKINKKFLCEN
ncbi:collectin-11 [Elysia marginata]|uniref:Collectin-11 n=1 Tax=Elysia marginata TaxID=1093978 RepID=A0AAV4I1Q0_9GAST|nr:collectin-11 [Elysia marginata]